MDRRASRARHGTRREGDPDRCARRRWRSVSTTSDVAFAPVQPRKRGPLGRLYHGETNINFIGRTKLWFTLSAIFLIIGLGSLFVRGLNLGIDFEGGAVFQIQTDSMTVEQARSALAPFGLEGAKVQELTSESGRSIRVQ